MAGPFEQYQEKVNEFNKKFGVNFSFEAVETEHLKLINLQENFHASSNGVVSSINKLYRTTLLDLYRGHVLNAMLNNKELIYPEFLYKDFNSLMEHYRTYCTEQGRTAPDVNGGWENPEVIAEAMREKIKDITPDKSDYIKEQYLGGKYPLRQMRAELDVIKGKNPPTADSTLKASVNIWEKTCGTRSIELPITIAAITK